MFAGLVVFGVEGIVLHATRSSGSSSIGDSFLNRIINPFLLGYGVEFLDMDTGGKHDKPPDDRTAEVEGYLSNPYRNEGYRDKRDDEKDRAGDPEDAIPRNDWPYPCEELSDCEPNIDDIHLLPFP